MDFCCCLKTNTRTTKYTNRYGLNVFFLPKSCVGDLMHNVMVSGGEPFGEVGRPPGWDGNRTNGINVLIKEILQSSLTPQLT